MVEERQLQVECSASREVCKGLDFRFTRPDSPSQINNTSARPHKMYVPLSMSQHVKPGLSCIPHSLKQSRLGRGGDAPFW